MSDPGVELQFRLRRDLAGGRLDGCVETVGIGYRIAVDEDQLDVTRFQRGVRCGLDIARDGCVEAAIEAFEAALREWRGPALDGLDSPQLTAAAAGLAEQRLAAVEQLAALRLRAGDLAVAIAELTTLLSEYPLRETLRALLMTALYRSGRQADALSAYEQGRRLVADRLGLDPGPALRALHEQILRADPALDAVVDSDSTAHAHGTAVASPRPAGAGRQIDPSPDQPGVPCLLPRAIGDFAGRAGDVTRLFELTTQTRANAVVIMAIDGMGGVGKTTLALHVAHRIADQFPDGQYFIDLHGFTDGIPPVSAATALETLLLDSGVPAEQIPTDLERRSGAWRARLAGRRVLLLLDNAVDAAQVQPLLPGSSGALVLVTSRRRLAALDGALPLSLDVLSHDDAVTLFTRIVADHRVADMPRAVDEVVELCGRLPLAIRIAACRLRNRSGWTIDDLVGRLRDQRHRGRLLATRDRSVAAALTLSYQHLTEPQRRLLRALSLHPGPDFDAYTAAALAGITLEQTEQSLEDLLDDNLLIQRVPDRYQFHDLIRDCVRTIADRYDDPATRRATRHRLLDYYLHSTDAWSRPITKRVYRLDCVYQLDLAADGTPAFMKAASTSDQGMAHLRAEQANLEAVTMYAIRDGWHSYAWQLTWALHSFLSKTNCGGAAVEMIEGAMRAARILRDRRAESRMMTMLGLAMSARQRNIRAEQLFQRAIELARQVGDSALEGTQLINLGTAQLRDHRLEAAGDSFRYAQRLAERVGDDKAVCAMANNLAVIELALGHLDQARDHLYAALNHPAAAAVNIERFAVTNLGRLAVSTSNYANAVSKLLRAVDLFHAEEQWVEEAETLTILSEAYRGEGWHGEALAVARRALKIAQTYAFLHVECEALNALAEILVVTGRWDEADKVYQENAGLARDRNLLSALARSHEGLAHVAAHRGDLAAAHDHWTAALDTHPPRSVGADNARRHLHALGHSAQVTCRRCETNNREELASTDAARSVAVQH